MDQRRSPRFSPELADATGGLDDDMKMGGSLLPISTPDFFSTNLLGKRRSESVTSVSDFFAGNTPSLSSRRSPRLNPALATPTFTMPSPTLPPVFAKNPLDLRRSPRIQSSKHDLSFSPAAFLSSPTMLPRSLAKHTLPPNASTETTTHISLKPFSHNGSGFDEQEPAPQTNMSILNKLQQNNIRLNKKRRRDDDYGDKLKSSTASSAMLPQFTPPTRPANPPTAAIPPMPQLSKSAAASGSHAPSAAGATGAIRNGSAHHGPHAISNRGDHDAPRSHVSSGHGHGHAASHGHGHGHGNHHGMMHDVSSGSHSGSQGLPKSTGNGSGSSCHQCKSRRSMGNLIFCCNMFTKRTKDKRRVGKEKRHVCRKKYCDQCLQKFYQEKAPTKRQDPSSQWPCPACRGICCCAACRRQKAKTQTVDPLTMSPATSLACGLVYFKDMLKFQLGDPARASVAMQKAIQSLNNGQGPFKHNISGVPIPTEEEGDAEGDNDGDIDAADMLNGDDSSSSTSEPNGPSAMKIEPRMSKMNGQSGGILNK